MINLEWKQDNNDYGYFFAEASVEDGQTSDFIKLEHNALTTVYAFPEGRCTVEYTPDDVATINAGNADWLSWPKGRVRRDTSDTILGVVSAVRLVSDNGAARVKIRAK